MHVHTTHRRRSTVGPLRLTLTGLHMVGSTTKRAQRRSDRLTTVKRKGPVDKKITKINGTHVARFAIDPAATYKGAVR